jgi:hypothetical protein
MIGDAALMLAPFGRIGKRPLPFARSNARANRWEARRKLANWL